jgi:hypothetical protein
MASEFQVNGRVAEAPFSLKIHRGEGMCLLAMDWKAGEPPRDFVGFAIEYREPNRDRFFALKNQLCFDGTPRPAGAGTDPARYPTTIAPIQKFRWVHFPRSADLPGEFTYRVTPVFMNSFGELSNGIAQLAALDLSRETYPGRINVTFTRGFVSSQAFVDRYLPSGPLDTLVPENADEGLRFVPTHPKAAEAYRWMGFEARGAVLDVLDEAVADPAAQVRVVAYDLNLPDIVTRLEQLGPRLKIIIDDSADHGPAGSGESQSADRLRLSAGAANVKRQHMKNLQHNKLIIVETAAGGKVVCGSTNFTWRGMFVQSNNALVLSGANAVAPFAAAFDAYWDDPEHFGTSAAAEWVELGFDGIDAKVTFSPHSAGNAVLDSIATDMKGADSCVLYSLAFIHQTGGAVREAIEAVTNDPDIFVYGVSDRQFGIDVQMPNGNVQPVSASELGRNVPEPFKSEPSARTGPNQQGGTKLHHKFVVIDFDKPSARVYTGSYNVSPPADNKNGENLLLVRDRRIVVAYMIEALRIFDHYQFRVAQREARRARTKLELKKAPAAAGDDPWWAEYYSEPVKIRDRELFS